MDNFKRLSMQELYDVEGGIFGVDDAIFWTFVAAGFAGGIAINCPLCQGHFELV